MAIDVGSTFPVKADSTGYCPAGVEWRALDSLCERDRAYLWSAGLLYFDEFAKEPDSWGDDISYPEKRAE